MSRGGGCPTVITSTRTDRAWHPVYTTARIHHRAHTPPRAYTAARIHRRTHTPPRAYTPHAHPHALRNYNPSSRVRTTRHMRGYASLSWDLVRSVHGFAPSIEHALVDTAHVNHLLPTDLALRCVPARRLEGYHPSRRAFIRWVAWSSGDPVTLPPDTRTLDVTRFRGWAGPLLPNWAPVGGVQSLCVRGDCTGIRSLHGLHAYAGLLDLRLHACQDLADLRALASTTLHTLHLTGCSRLRDLAPIGSLASLRTLTLSGSHELTVLQGPDGHPAFHRCTALETLDLGHSLVLRSTAGLGACPALHTLSLAGCQALTDVDGLGECLSLDTLDLSWCLALQSVDGLRPCHNLATLTLSGCRALPTLSGLEVCAALCTLNVSWCALLTDLSSLRHCPRLEWLCAAGCAALVTLFTGDGFPALTRLNLSWCTGLVWLGGSTPSLVAVDLSGCTSLESVADLQGCPALLSLHLTWCTSLSSVSGLGGALQSLDLTGCHLVESG
jgi:hypothetical protein